MHFVLERFKGRIEEKGPLALAAYLFFLPTIVVGPIHRFPPFERDARRLRWSAAMVSEGLERILYGYAKIAVLGNFLVSQVYAGWAAEQAPPGSPLALYLLMLQIGFNLYFQFAGYSDVAIGFARLLGFRVMENFDRPFLQKNISDFWRSWHISLTSWAREYVYGAVASLTRSPALAVLATLVAIGLWHEVSLRYLLWGCYHGAGIVLWQRLQPLWRRFPPLHHPALRRVLNAGSILLTLHFVLLGFLLVRQPDVAAMAATAERLLFSWI
jgi:alginate O-acetyltransferase complex protein AlgI